MTSFPWTVPSWISTHFTPPAPFWASLSWIPSSSMVRLTGVGAGASAFFGTSGFLNSGCFFLAFFSPGSSSFRLSSSPPGAFWRLRAGTASFLSLGVSVFWASSFGGWSTSSFCGSQGARPMRGLSQSWVKSTGWVRVGTSWVESSIRKSC